MIYFGLHRTDLKIGLSDIGKLYIVCAVLQNALTCLYGNLTSEPKFLIYNHIHYRSISHRNVPGYVELTQLSRNKQSEDEVVLSDGTGHPVM